MDIQSIIAFGVFSIVMVMICLCLITYCMSRDVIEDDSDDGRV